MHYQTICVTSRLIAASMLHHILMSSYREDTDVLVLSALAPAQLQQLHVADVEGSVVDIEPTVSEAYSLEDRFCLLYTAP